MEWKDPLGTLRCIAIGTEEMTGILQREGRKRKEELLLQGMKHSVSHRKKSVKTQLVRDVYRAGPRTRAALGLALLRAASKVKGIKARALITWAAILFSKRVITIYNTSNAEQTKYTVLQLKKDIVASIRWYLRVSLICMYLNY